MPIGTQFGYVQFLGKHREHGEAILVNPALHPRQGHFAAGFFAGGYVTFFPATLAVTQRRAEVVAQSSPPSVPKRFRRPGVVLPDGKVETWVIEGGWRKVTKRELSDKERSIPISATWNHETLSAQIASGWRPETDSQ
ncbi:MAG TPA: hypothetical protein VFS58_07315 [Steroidobacteraceae bacterium]|nr:hypothetical protein [Steroidobacteraceae bacterium]